MICVLRSLIWGFGEKLYVIHCITSQPANVSLMVLYSNFHQLPSGWLKFQRGLSTPGLGVRGDVTVGDQPIPEPAHGFLLAPHLQIWSISYRFRQNAVSLLPICDDRRTPALFDTHLRQSYISRTVWPRITKFYTNLHTGRVYNHTGYDVTSYFWSEVII